MPAFAITLAAASVLLGGIFFAPTEQTSAVVQAAADETPTVLAPAVPEQEVASVVVEAPTLQVEEVVDVTALAPDVIVAEAASTTSSLSDMPTSWADGQVTLGWTADVPFILDENIAITSTDVSQLPVPIGSRLTSVNGQDVADLSAVDAAINDAVTASDGTLVQMTLGWTAPDGDSTFSTELPVDVIYKTSFKSGVHFETSFVEDKWITRVTETPEIEGYALQLGDEIVALVPENERIVGATSLAEVTDLAASKNRTELQFAIRRDNTLWIADIMLTQEAG